MEWISQSTKRPGAYQLGSTCPVGSGSPAFPFPTHIPSILQYTNVLNRKPSRYGSSISYVWSNAFEGRPISFANDALPKPKPAFFGVSVWKKHQTVWDEVRHPNCLVLSLLQVNSQTRVLGEIRQRRICGEGWNFPRGVSGAWCCCAGNCWILRSADTISAGAAGTLVLRLSI